MKTENTQEELSDKEASKWSKHVKKHILRMQDEALGVSKSISEEHRGLLRRALQQMQGLIRIKDPKICTGKTSAEEAEKSLADYFHKLYEIGFSLDENKTEWFEIVGKLTSCLGSGTLPRGKYKQITAARFIGNFLIYNMRPSNKALLAELCMHNSREVTQDQVSEMVESMGLSELMLQEKRGRK